VIAFMYAAISGVLIVLGLTDDPPGCRVHAVVHGARLSAGPLRQAGIASRLAITAD
jgi:hypothetical protein